MIEAIIFDCFGVLTSDAWLPFKRRQFGHDHELAAQATDLNKQVDAGLADYDDFISGVAELAGMSAAQARAEIESNVANEPLFAYIRDDLKPKYKIALLSNAGADWLDQLFSTQQAQLFDEVALSYATGFVKPDERAYNGVTDRLGVQPDACLFIDDQERYCTGARDVGMHAVLYKNFEQAHRDIDAILSDPKN